MGTFFLLIIMWLLFRYWGWGLKCKNFICSVINLFLFTLFTPYFFFLLFGFSLYFLLLLLDLHFSHNLL